MEHQTVIGFYIDSTMDNLSTKEVADRIDELGRRLVKCHPLYQWGIKDGGDTFIVDKKGVAAAFAAFAAFIRSAGVDSEDGEFVVGEVPERYADEGFDVEDGDCEFGRSFKADFCTVAVYVNTDSWYASEIKDFDLGEPRLGISCDMKDLDGDYYELEV